MDRITAIRKSLTAFTCGIIGCVPFLGLIPAIVALVIVGRVRSKYRDWNPAGRYLFWGGALGALGILISALAAFAIVLARINDDCGSGFYTGGGE